MFWQIVVNSGGRGARAVSHDQCGMHAAFTPQDPPGSIDMTGVALHLDTGGGLGQPIRLLDAGAQLHRLAVLARRRGRHLCLGRVLHSVATVEQRLVLTHHRQRFLGWTARQQLSSRTCQTIFPGFSITAMPPALTHWPQQLR